MVTRQAVKSCCTLSIDSVWNFKPWIQMKDCVLDKPICQIYKRVPFSQWGVVNVVVLILSYVIFSMYNYDGKIMCLRQIIHVNIKS